jgi:hypothetical protein
LALALDLLLVLFGGGVGAVSVTEKAAEESM